MDDKEQAAIDALRAAGLEAEALAVEQLRERQKDTMDAYHAAQRDSYKNGQAAESERRVRAERLLARCRSAMSSSQQRGALITDWTHMIAEIDARLEA